MDYNVTSSRPPSTSLPNHNTKCVVRGHHRAAGQGNREGLVERTYYFPLVWKFERMRSIRIIYVPRLNVMQHLQTLLFPIMQGDDAKESNYRLKEVNLIDNVTIKRIQQ